MSGSLRVLGGGLALLAVAAGCRMTGAAGLSVPLAQGVIPEAPSGVMRGPFVMSKGEEVDLAKLLAGGILPSFQPGEAWVWSSSAPATVVVGVTDGRARAVGVGSAIVEAGRHGGAPALTLDVTVLQDARAIAIEGLPAQVILGVGQRLRLIATVVRADGTLDGNVRWGSRDDSIVSVDAWTGEVVGERPGRASVEVAAIPGRDVFKVVSVQVATGGPTP